MSARIPHLVALALGASLLAAPAGARKAKAGKQSHSESSSKEAPAPKVDPSCKEPAAVDGDLKAGLVAYAEGRWPEAVTALSTWAERPDAEVDPGASRGLYCLGYAARTAGSPAVSDKAWNRAQPLLKARMATAPTLEAAYYLQAIYQVRADQAAQLAVISVALKNAADGKLCASPDGDDLFRIARLHGSAGSRAEQVATLERASAAYEAAGAPTQYRAMTEKDLGEAKFAAGDGAAAVKHLGLAASLDPNIPGVHRAYGIALIRAGRLKDAADWWRDNWRRERNDGNSLIYAIPTIDKVVRLRPIVGDKGVQDIAPYTTLALETNAEVEAKRFLELADKRGQARAGGGDLSAEDAVAIDVAELRMAQFMVEYVARGSDLQEFALQKGLLPAIHRRDLPTRKSRRRAPRRGEALRDMIGPFRTSGEIPMRRLAVFAAFLLVMFASPRDARAWSPAMYDAVVDQAGRLMPASLQRVLAENIGRLHDGAAAPLAKDDDAYLRAGQPGSRGTLDETVQSQVQRVLDLLGKRAPMSTVAYEMGVLSHYVTLANTPAVAGNADAREADWADAFERFTETRVPRFRLVFDGYWSPSLGKDDVRGFVQECRVRSGRHYDVLSMLYVKEDGSIAANDFDDHSPVFGVASLAYAHAIGDTAKIWLYTWIRANGDTTGLPFPQALQVGPAVEEPK